MGRGGARENKKQNNARDVNGKEAKWETIGRRKEAEIKGMSPSTSASEVRKRTHNALLFIVSIKINSTSDAKNTSKGACSCNFLVYFKNSTKIVCNDFH